MAKQRQNNRIIDEWDDSLDVDSHNRSVDSSSPSLNQKADSEWDDIPSEWQASGNNHQNNSGQNKNRGIVIASAVGAIFVFFVVMFATGIIGGKPPVTPTPPINQTSENTFSPSPEISASPIVTNTPTQTPIVTNTPSPTPEPIVTDTPIPKAISNPVVDRYYWYSPEMRYFYHFLTDHEKQVFDTIYDASIQFKTTVSIDISSKDEMQHIIFVLQRDCPELFNLTLEFSYTYTSVRLTYRMDQDTYNKICDSIHSVFDIFESSFPASSDEFEKQLVIYKYLIEHCEYLIAGDDSTAYADACLYYGKAQCSGYANALMLALRHFGIRSVFATSDEHAWNLVNINGQWYNCDATWDDTNIGASEIPNQYLQDDYYAWMNLPDRFYVTDDDHHLEDIGDFSFPKATSIADSYVNRKGCYIPAGETNVAENISKCLQLAKQDGKRYMLIMLDDQSYLDNWESIWNDLYIVYDNYGWAFYSPDEANRCVYAVFEPDN